MAQLPNVGKQSPARRVPLARAATQEQPPRTQPAAKLPDRWDGTLAVRIKGNVNAVELRDSPSPFGETQERLQPGTRVLAHGRQGDWTAISVSSGRHGFVPAAVLEVP